MMNFQAVKTVAMLRPMGAFTFFCNTLRPAILTVVRSASSSRTVPTSSTLAPTSSSLPLATVNIGGRQFEKDSISNVTEHIIKHLPRKLYQQKYHPIGIIKQRIVDFFYQKFVGRTGNPIFSVYDNLDPIVTVQQNFDSLLVPPNHISRRVSESYYINSKYLLRAHTTAHQSELISSGLDNFVIVGDVYRRDSIDSLHYPIFHQCDAVRLQNQHELFPEESGLKVFEKRPDKRTEDKQAEHTVDATRIVAHQLKTTLQDLAKILFGPTVEYRWVEAHFPFTHPSWELEIKHKGDWVELLGCGIIEHAIAAHAGVNDRIGWAFGLGIERVAMMHYCIPDIRLFWSTDSGFLHQFHIDDPSSPITYKPVSVYPQCRNDISFWLPADGSFCERDFFDVVRCVGGDLIEQVSLVDKFVHPKKMLTSHCYRITYRHMERTLLKNEVNELHGKIAKKACEALRITVRGRNVDD